jgi:aminoglycoside N3'-acetyltransferase
MNENEVNEMSIIFPEIDAIEDDKKIVEKTVQEQPKKESKFTTIKVTRESSHKFKEVAVAKNMTMYELFDEIAKTL